MQRENNWQSISGTFAEEPRCAGREGPVRDTFTAGVEQPRASSDCIRCAKCAHHMPHGNSAYLLTRLSRRGNLEEASREEGDNRT